MPAPLITFSISMVAPSCAEADLGVTIIAPEKGYRFPAGDTRPAFPLFSSARQVSLAFPITRVLPVALLVMRNGWEGVKITLLRWEGRPPAVVPRATRSGCSLPSKDTTGFTIVWEERSLCAESSFSVLVSLGRRRATAACASVSRGLEERMMRYWR